MLCQGVYQRLLNVIEEKEKLRNYLVPHVDVFLSHRSIRGQDVSYVYHVMALACRHVLKIVDSMIRQVS